MRATVPAGVLAILCGASLANAPAVAGAAPDQLRDGATVTYQVVPSRHVIHVTVQLKPTNKKPGTWSQRRCTGWAFNL